MVQVRPTQPPSDQPDGPSGSAAPGQGGRLNLLLSCASWRPQTWADLLPRLLEPMGVHTLRVGSGREATQVIRQHPIHIAVVDLGLPLAGGDGCNEAEEAGTRLLELLARLETSPPTLVIKRRCPGRDHGRELARVLHAGAFAVLEPAVRLETMLETLRRVLHRHYAGRWPGAQQTPPAPAPPTPPFPSSPPETSPDSPPDSPPNPTGTTPSR